jgi:hypothetical protein
MRLNTLIRFFFLLLFLPEAFAADSFTIYLVKNRPADEMVKVASSVFQGKANITSSNEKIIISANKKTTTQVIALLEELDQKTQSLKVSFRWRENSQREENQKSVSGGVRGKNWGIKNSPTPTKGGASVSVGGVNANVSESNREGISYGTDSVVLSANGEGSISLSDFEQGSALKVKAKSLSTNLVTLDLEQLGRNGLSVGSLKTNITVPINQWKALGGVKKSNQGTQKEILGKNEQTGTSFRDLEVLVEHYKN